MKLRKNTKKLQAGNIGGSGVEPLSVRQVQRLVRLYRTDGATAFASSRRGRPANSWIDEETRCKALDLIRCYYPNFSPTLATEKQAERHHIQLSVETARNRMTADGLWRPHSRRQPQIYQPRLMPPSPDAPAIL
ncbi:hypothetical protein ACRS85_28035 [Pluralibacter gergoviae]|uniref:hypothetical protein n=1 Tax=Pluralibacter gergoviae TaxID=61647 RepID=UPI003EDFBEE4